MKAVLNKEKDVFYQAKLDYYKVILIALCIVAPISETMYFVSDCQLFNRFAYETILPRFLVLIPPIIFLLTYKKIKTYKILSLFSIFILHSVLWCTIWATYYLPDKSYTREGFIIMHLMFLIIGIAIPKHYCFLGHSFVIASIIISHKFLQFEKLDVILSLSIPCFLGIQILNIVLENIYSDHYKLLKQIELSSKLDSLTKVYNRHILKDIVNKETNELINSKNVPISMAIIDIDYFKKINDTYGHLKGDDVIVYIVNLIKNTIHKKDCMIRWGGEEFLIIFYNMEVKAALDKCEEIRKKVETSNNGVCKVTVSIGISDYSKDYIQTVSHADLALYKAKSTGRNTVVIYDKSLENKQ